MLHLDSAARRRHVEFLHVSKSGGTSLCAAAQRNGCTSKRFDEEGNCMVDIFGCVGGARVEARLGSRGRGRVQGGPEPLH